MNSLNKILRILLIALTITLPMTQSLAVEPSGVEFTTGRLKVGDREIQVQVAQSEEQRQHGLMFRKSLGADDGMLFMFGGPAHACMWMKNTSIPLSVAFIDRAGLIINIEDMEPNTTDSHCGKGLVWYALEMHQGWFKKNKIEPGTRITSLP